MKKVFLIVLYLCISISLFACEKKKNVDTMSLGGVEYPAKYVRSGYYFDKASFSEATLASMLERVEMIEKPNTLGTVEFPDLSKIELMQIKEEEITSAMIEAEIEKERDREVTFSPVKTKREAMLTDKVTIELTEFIDGKENYKEEDIELILSPGQFLPGVDFEEQIVGHKAGKKFSFDIKYPDEYVPEVAGKTATFDIIIKSIEEAHTPEVNDDFVKSHTTKGSNTLDEYKEEIKIRIKNRNEIYNNQNLVLQLYNKLFEECKFNPTEDALAWAFSMQIVGINQQAQANGVSLSELIGNVFGGTVNDTYEAIKMSMPMMIQGQMLIEELLKKYKINITEDDVKEWHSVNMADLYMGLSYDDFIKYYGYEQLLNDVQFYKALLPAVKECKIVDEEVEE